MTLELENSGCWLGRVWNTEAAGPSVVTVRENRVFDITSRAAPTVRDICEMEDPAGYVRTASGIEIGALDEFFVDGSAWTPLAPIDFQAVKACGVTFAGSMVERVIEEQAAGDPSQAEAIRRRVGETIGNSLRNITPGSAEAAQIKKALIAEGLWSQYLEVGIGPDAEVFSKAQVLSSVGHLSQIGLHPVSRWNNPEPEVVLAVTSTGRVVGATLGNDVNLRDVEGRSALLLSKAKDNNGSCAIGPMLRLFDRDFGIDDIRKAELGLRVTGTDGFVLEGRSDMTRISRDPLDLVRQTVGPHHQYPDGFALFLGTLFAPTQDRDAPGQGFTHKLGDVVEIWSERLGTLRNTVNLSTECPPWVFGPSQLMRNLAQRELL